VKLVYVAGPYRGPTILHVIRNILRARRAALTVWRAGGVALCPHLNTAFFDDSLADTWLAGDIELVRRSDAVWVIGGWHRSAGALAEAVEACHHGIPLLYGETAVRRFLEASR